MSTTEKSGTNGQAAVSASQLTAENRTVAIGDERFVYRRFGDDRTQAPPLLCLQHFRGDLDSWDPALVDRLAEHREVILLANRGVGGSTGVVREDATEMARDALRFVDALGLQEIDVLGFSLGGYVAQEMAATAAAAAADRAGRHRAPGRS